MWCLAARGSGLGSRTSRTANTMSRGRGVKGHTRSGADDEPRSVRASGQDATQSRAEGRRPWPEQLVATITHDEWRGRALPAELHPQDLRGEPSASTEVVSQQVVKDRPPSPVARSIDRVSAPTRRPVEVRNEKGPDPFGIRASAYRSLEGARLHAALSRMHSVLVPIKRPTAKGLAKSAARRIDRMQGGAACAQRPHRHRRLQTRHERGQTLHGPVGSDGVPGFHDKAPEKSGAR